jgi:hypothetical protein
MGAIFMKRFLWLILILLCVLPIQAQDDLTPYEVALQKIEEARVSGATSLDLSGLGLAELPTPHHPKLLMKEHRLF